MPSASNRYVLLAAALACGCPADNDDAASAAPRKAEPPATKGVGQPPPPPVQAPGVKEDGSIVSAVSWFDGRLEDALAEAKATNKLVFMDVGAYWCPPCHELDEKVFVEPEVGEFLAAGYVAVHIDAEKGEGPEIVRQYKVQAYPSMLVLEPSGLEKGRIVDFVAPEPFIAAMKRLSAGENVLAELAQAVELNPDDPKARHALGHAYALAARRDDANEQFDAVLLADPKDELGLASQVLYDRAMFFTYKLDGDLPGAIKEFEALQRRFGDSKAALTAYRRIGRLHKLQGDDAAAIAALDKMLATDPEDTSLAAGYGWFSFRQRVGAERGLEVVVAAIGREAKRAELHYLRAELEHQLGRDAEALAAIKEASALEPRSAFYKRQVRRFAGLVGT